MIRAEEVIPIGVFRRAHGYQGELQCLMQNAYWENADAGFVVLKLENIYVPFRVTDWRCKGADSVIFKLKDIDSDAEAGRYIGVEAYMFRSDMKGEEETQMTWQDLKGFRVVDEQEGEIGVVGEVDESTINTFLTLEDGRMMPIHEDFMVSIDPDARVLHVRLPFVL